MLGGVLYLIWMRVCAGSFFSFACTLKLYTQKYSEFWGIFHFFFFVNLNRKMQFFFSHVHSKIMSPSQKLRFPFSALYMWEILYHFAKVFKNAIYFALLSTNNLAYTSCLKMFWRGFQIDFCLYFFRISLFCVYEILLTSFTYVICNFSLFR